MSLVSDKPALSVVPGSPIAFFGTIVNTSGAVKSLNGFDFGQLGPNFGVAGLTADAAPFFDITPFTRGVGASTEDIALFTWRRIPMRRRAPTPTPSTSWGRSSSCRRRPRPARWACGA